MLKTMDLARIAASSGAKALVKKNKMIVLRRYLQSQVTKSSEGLLNCWLGVAKEIKVGKDPNNRERFQLICDTGGWGLKFKSH